MKGKRKGSSLKYGIQLKAVLNLAIHLAEDYSKVLLYKE